MRVIKKINNNVALCLDNGGNELVAFGIGIGFPDIPYELEDLDIVTHTYYGVDQKYMYLLNEITEEIFIISEKIIRVAQELIDYELNNSLAFTLSDHINFAIERAKKGMNIMNPMYHDIRQYYEIELEVGDLAVKMINRQFDCDLPKEEAANLALHFINAKKSNDAFMESIEEKETIFKITRIIENSFKIRIDEKSFNYSRFVSHLQYLFKRKLTNQQISSDNLKLYSAMKKDFPETFECMKEIRKYIEKRLEWHVNDEEMLYLMLHVNRLCVRQDCNQ